MLKWSSIWRPLICCRKLPPSPGQKFCSFFLQEIFFLFYRVSQNLSSASSGTPGPHDRRIDGEGKGTRALYKGIKRSTERFLESNLPWQLRIQTVFSELSFQSRPFLPSPFGHPLASAALPFRCATDFLCQTRLPKFNCLHGFPPADLSFPYGITF